MPLFTVAIIRQMTRSQRFQTSYWNAQVYMRDFARIVRVSQNAHRPTKSGGGRKRPRGKSENDEKNLHNVDTL